MHGGNNFPLRKSKSTLDLSLPDVIRDEEYLSQVSKNLQTMLDNINWRPDVVFYVAGVDVCEVVLPFNLFLIFQRDKLGRMKISTEGLRKREAYIMVPCSLGANASA